MKKTMKILCISVLALGLSGCFFGKDIQEEWILTQEQWMEADQARIDFLTDEVVPAVPSSSSVKERLEDTIKGWILEMKSREIKTQEARKSLEAKASK